MSDIKQGETEVEDNETILMGDNNQISFEVNSNICWICGKGVEPIKAIEGITFIYQQGSDFGRMAHTHCVINVARLVMENENWDKVTFRVSSLKGEANNNIFDF